MLQKRGALFLLLHHQKHKPRSRSNCREIHYESYLLANFENYFETTFESYFETNFESYFETNFESYV